MLASDASSSLKRFHLRSLDHTCGSIFEGINAVLSAFCATTFVYSGGTTVYNGESTRLYCEVCY